jgi:hypothetical protein
VRDSAVEEEVAALVDEGLDPVPKLDELLTVAEGELELRLIEDERAVIELEPFDVSNVEERLVLLAEEIPVVDDDVARMLVDDVVCVVAVDVGVPTMPM